MFKLFRKSPFIILKSKISTKKSTIFPIYRRIFNSYIELINIRPLLTKSCTSLILYFSADFISQYAKYKSANAKNSLIFTNESREDNIDNVNNVNKVDKIFEIDFARLLTFTLMGGLFVGPTLHIWYGLLSKSLPGLGLISICKRIAFDQMLFTPFFISTFFCVSLILESKIENVPIKLKNDLLPTLFTNYIVWIPAQFIN